MTRDERLLLASVLRHIRETPPYKFQAQPYQIDENTWVDFDEDGITVRRDGRFGWGDRYLFRSVTEGVDLAVALGLLPADFSSAYRAGVAARSTDFETHVDRALAIGGLR